MGIPENAIPAGPLLVLDIDAVLPRFPADVRAAVQWARKPIADTLLRLRTQPLTDELLDEVPSAFQRPMQAVAVAVWNLLSDAPDELRAALLQELVRDEVGLSTFVEDDASRETVAWAIETLRAFYSASISMIPRGVAFALDMQADVTPELHGFIAGLATLMAAAEEARAQGSVERARELVDCTYLLFTDFRKRMQEEGLDVAAEAIESPDERRVRLAAAIKRLRGSLTPDDWEMMSEARMSAIR